MPKLRSHGPALLLCCGQNHCPCARDSRRLDGQELGSLKETIDKTLGLAVRAEKENNSDKAGRDKPTATYDWNHGDASNTSRGSGAFWSFSSTSWLHIGQRRLLVTSQVFTQGA